MLRFVVLLAAIVVVVPAAAPAKAALNVFACEPEWGALASEIGGAAVSVFTATTARQDPHQIQARPALIARLRGADLAACTGAELEIGWMPALLRQAANGRVQPGSPGNFAAADFVQRLEIPTRLDRADGDVHPAGNPHIHLDPRNIRLVAVALAQRLALLDPANAAAYNQGRDAFLQRWDAALRNWESSAAALKGVKVVVQHKNLTYLLAWLGMEEAATIEPKPGIAPGSAYLAQLLDDIPRKQARAILYTSYEESRAPLAVGERSKLPVVLLPFTVGGSDRATTLTALFDDIVERLRAITEGGRAHP